jgi:hypothetical protein
MNFLFTALFADDTVIEQTPEDVSKLNDQKSCFYDVLEKEKDVQLLIFGLIGENNSYLIDLIDGRWEINGVSIYFDNKKHIYPTKNRLIYYKTRSALFSPFGYYEQQPDIYHIGWQNTVNNQNIKQILQIQPDGTSNFLL